MNTNTNTDLMRTGLSGEGDPTEKRRNGKGKSRATARALVIGAAALVSATLLTANCLAAEISETEDGAISYAEGPTYVAPETRTEDMISDGQSTDDAETDAVAGGTSEEPSGSTDTAKDPMAAAVDALHEHLGEILSALTLIGSLAIAFTYKRGLLPLLSGALGRLGDTSGAAKASAESAAQTAEQIHSTVKSATAETARICGELTDGIHGMTQRIVQMETQLAQSRKADSATVATVELLYDIFMSSSLPNYRKEEVSARLKSIMAALASDGTETALVPNEIKETTNENSTESGRDIA